MIWTYFITTYFICFNKFQFACEENSRNRFLRRLIRLISFNSSRKLNRHETQKWRHQICVRVSRKENDETWSLPVLIKGIENFQKYSFVDHPQPSIHLFTFNFPLGYIITFFRNQLCTLFVVANITKCHNNVIVQLEWKLFLYCYLDNALHCISK